MTESDTVPDMPNSDRVDLLFLPLNLQLATALKALKGIGISHTDLKLDNIMLVDQTNQPLRAKLIDFGLAVPASQIKRGTILQPLCYR